jgi:2-oxoglutarate/2-oxoacid ferredoxin oxidoreductase subunit alpha
MKNSILDFQLVISSVNGSGTLTANRILHKSLFRQGYHVVGKNLFPSNIEGLPTYYFLRISKNFNSLKKSNDVYVALNPGTYPRDTKTLTNSETLFLLNSDLKLEAPNTNPNHSISFKKTVANSEAQLKIKKRMSNMCYVGWIGRYLSLDLEIIKEVIHDQFSSKKVADENIKVMLEGWESFDSTPLTLDETLLPSNSKNKQILIEGNQATALGWVDGGCTVATWYPITPSTSVVESFETYAKSLRPKINSATAVAVLQAEDEISAIASVVGAGWAGARSATATSGPGLSLMSEALGLAYFAEIPAIVCDVQRVGPSTGLPTRTSQGDLEFAYKISHGDTFHPVLLPANPKECFEMSTLAFDISDKYQTPVFILSDLDLGMNLWTSDVLVQSDKSFERSQILNELDLEAIHNKGEKFKRYLGNESGIPNRTLPGTHHPDAAYFTRGSGHNESAGYSEHPEDYELLMNRLKTKILNSRPDLPKPIIELIKTNADLEDESMKFEKSEKKFGAIFFGTTAQIFPELNQILETPLNLCQVRSLPLHDEVYKFIADHDFVFVIEQNRDGQLRNIILQNNDVSISNKIISITHFNGWSIQADDVSTQIKNIISECI